MVVERVENPQVLHSGGCKFFGIVRGNSVTFYRVDYDFETTAGKIKNDPDIDDINGERLLVGK